MKKQSMALFYISLTGNNTGEEEKIPSRLFSRLAAKLLGG